jgi:hypothetical protein
MKTLLAVMQLFSDLRNKECLYIDNIRRDFYFIQDDKGVKITSKSVVLKLFWNELQYS